jgi:hypothetical protein
MTQQTTVHTRRLIDAHIKSLGTWRGELLAGVRVMILEAVAGVEEEWKWEIPVWSLDGIICTGEAYKQAVKLTFAHGAKLKDPSGLFNASLDGKTRRAIDLREGDRLSARAFKALVREAVAHNRASTKKPKTKRASARPVRLLSGENPKIAKGNGAAPVKEYIAAIPGWKGKSAALLDALIVKTVPGVQKAVKWNSAFYGMESGSWFLCFHVYARYLKVTFFRGTSLEPLPAEPSRAPETRYAHISEGEFDEARFRAWVKQAAALPGEKL